MSNHDILTLMLAAVQLSVSTMAIVFCLQPSDPYNPQPGKFAFLTLVLVALSVAGVWLQCNPNAFK